MEQPFWYAVSVGDALHMIPATGHEELEDGALVVHGREDHRYGDGDWDLFFWADSRNGVYDMVGRIRVAKRLQV